MMKPEHNATSDVVLWTAELERRFISDRRERRGGKCGRRTAHARLHASKLAASGAGAAKLCMIAVDLACARSHRNRTLAAQTLSPDFTYVTFAAFVLASGYTPFP